MNSRAGPSQGSSPCSKGRSPGGGKAVTPKYDVAREACELRPLRPVYVKSGRQYEKVECQFSTRGFEAHAAILLTDAEWLAARDDGEIRVPRAAQHGIVRRWNSIVGDELHNGPAALGSKVIKAVPHAGAADAHAAIDSRHVPPADQHCDMRCTMFQRLGGVVGS